jgi:hypothetical protein
MQPPHVQAAAVAAASMLTGNFPPISSRRALRSRSALGEQAEQGQRQMTRQATMASLAARPRLAISSGPSVERLDRLEVPIAAGLVAPGAAAAVLSRM